MIERAIPRTGEQLPVVGLGTWQAFDVTPSEYDARARVLQRFVALGGRVVDSSPMYGRAEEVVGTLASREHLHPQLFVATKVWTRGAREGLAQMEASRRLLQVETIDLLQVHNLVDAAVHLETLAQWKAEGRVRYVGVTHYTVEAHAQLEPYLRRGDIDFVQVNYSLAVRDAARRLLPMAAEHGVATLINRPFESGAMFREAAQRPLPSVAAELGCRSWAQLFVKYAISHPAVTCIIPATTSTAHVEENIAAAVEPLPDAKMRDALVAAWEG